MSVQQVMTAKVLIEADDEFALASLRRYVVTAVKQSCRNVRGGAVVISLHSEDGRFLGLDIVGTPSEEMEEIVADLFGDEPDEKEGESSS